MITRRVVHCPVGNEEVTTHFGLHQSNVFGSVSQN